MKGLYLIQTPEQMLERGTKQVSLEGWGQGGKSFIIEGYAVGLLADYVAPDLCHFPLPKIVLCVGSMSGAKQGSPDIGIVLSKHGDELRADSIAQIGRQAVRGIPPRGKPLSSTIGLGLLAADLKQRSYYPQREATG